MFTSFHSADLSLDPSPGMRLYQEHSPTPLIPSLQLRKQQSHTIMDWIFFLKWTWRQLLFVMRSRKVQTPKRMKTHERAEMSAASGLNVLFPQNLLLKQDCDIRQKYKGFPRRILVKHPWWEFLCGNVKPGTRRQTSKLQIKQEVHHVMWRLC